MLQRENILKRLRNRVTVWLSGKKLRWRNPPSSGEVCVIRRKIVLGSVAGFLMTDFFMFLRFFFPRVLYEPKTTFTVGYPSDIPPGIDTEFKRDHRIWMVRDSEGVFAIFARCTHLGCTPNWLASEHKFKCPCHGSGYDEEGINIEGPAPRPMDRCYIKLLPTGKIEVDTSRLFKFPHWDGPQVILRGV